MMIILEPISGFTEMKSSLDQMVCIRYGAKEITFETLYIPFDTHVNVEE